MSLSGWGLDFTGKKKKGVKMDVHLGGCGGSFPEPEVDKEKKEEKACCHGGCVQCGGETGCGFGPVKKVRFNASGTPVLSQKESSRPPRYYLITTQNGRYRVDINSELQPRDFYAIVRPILSRPCGMVKRVDLRKVVFLEDETGKFSEADLSDALIEVYGEKMNSSGDFEKPSYHYMNLLNADISRVY